MKTNREINHRLQQTIPTPPSIRTIWSDLGRRAAEFMIADRLTSGVVLSPGAEDTYMNAQVQGRGVLLATAHLGNWELMAAAMSAKGFTFQAIAAGPKQGPLGELLIEHRDHLGVRTLAPGSGAREALKGLRAGETIALFIDQSTQERSRLIDFLGIDAPTPLTFERLLETSGAMPLFIWNHRDESGRYVIHVEEIPIGSPLEWLNARLSTLVLTYPAQWIWLHNRWSKRTPRASLPNEVPSPV